MARDSLWIVAMRRRKWTKNRLALTTRRTSLHCLTLMARVKRWRWLLIVAKDFKLMEESGMVVSKRKGITSSQTTLVRSNHWMISRLATSSCRTPYYRTCTTFSMMLVWSMRSSKWPSQCSKINRWTLAKCSASLLRATSSNQEVAVQDLVPSSGQARLSRVSWRCKEGKISPTTSTTRMVNTKEINLGRALVKSTLKFSDSSTKGDTIRLMRSRWKFRKSSAVCSRSEREHLNTSLAHETTKSLSAGWSICMVWPRSKPFAWPKLDFKWLWTG